MRARDLQLVEEHARVPVEAREHVAVGEAEGLAAVERRENDDVVPREEPPRLVVGRHALLETPAHLLHQRLVTGTEPPDHDGSSGSAKPSRPRCSSARRSSSRLIEPTGTTTSSGRSSSSGPPCGRRVTNPKPGSAVIASSA